jgi:hypothetical protein
MKILKTLPKMGGHGVVLEQFVRCGKPGCRCAQGEALHGPYFYRFERRGGRLVKRYVKRSEAPEARRACQLRRETQAESRRLQQGAQAALWGFRDSLRGLEP